MESQPQNPKFRNNPGIILKTFTHACWVILHLFLPSDDFFSKLTFMNEKFFQEDHQADKQFGSSLAGHFVGPGLGPNCSQRGSADNTGRQS